MTNPRTARYRLTASVALGLALTPALLSVAPGCSKSSTESTPSPPAGSSAAAAAEADAFVNPGVPLGSIASSLAGVSTWTFYAAAGSTVAIGADASCDDEAAQVCPPVAEVDVVTDSDGHPTGVAYVSATTLAVSSATLAQALTSDLKAAAGGSTGTQSLHPLGLLSGGDGGTSLVSTIGALVIPCAEALVGGFATDISTTIGSGLSKIGCPVNIGSACSAESGTPASSAPPPSVANDCGSSGNVDQAAFGEATNGLLSAPFVSNLSDLYNAEDPFQITGTGYAAPMSMRLAAMDALDGTTDWSPDEISAFVGRQSTANYLVYDGSMPCGDFNDPHTYLEIERAQLTGAAHQTCGGRLPNEMVIDVILNFFVRGPGHAVGDPGSISDGLTGATQPSSATFPYLPELNGVGSML